MKKAYSQLTVKSVSEDERIITGIASTPSPDRADDVVVPTGVKFALPIPLLWQHDHSQPIGEVTAAAVSESGIEITAKLASIDEPGPLQDRLNEAWQSIKSGLVKGLSIGFRGLQVEPNPNSDRWGLIFRSWEWFELSAVTVPANADASITSIKRIAKTAAEEHSAASGAEPQQPAEPATTAPVSDVTSGFTPVSLIDDPAEQGGVTLL
jgi:HK97 family phage prohead protease